MTILQVASFTHGRHCINVEFSLASRQMPSGSSLNFKCDLGSKNSENSFCCCCCLVQLFWSLFFIPYNSLGIIIWSTQLCFFEELNTPVYTQTQFSPEQNVSWNWKMCSFKSLEAREMVQWQKCLLCNHKDLSLELWYPHEKPGVVVHDCDPRLGDRDGQNPRGLLGRQLGKAVDFRFSEEHRLKI